MVVAGRRPRVAALLLALGLGAGAAPGAELRLGPEASPDALAAALAAASPGDRIVVTGGVQHGPLVVDRPLTLVGEGWPVLDGGGAGNVVAIRAADVTLRGFVIRGSGTSLDQESSGVAVDEAPRVRIEGNRLERVLFGVYLRRSPDGRVADNEIHGLALPLARRGDAIRVWYSNGTTIEGNRVEAARDVVLWYSADLTVRGNRVADGRYGLHFMYCDDARIEENLLLANSVGAFLMYSRRLRLRHNTIAGNQGPSGYGVGLKDMDDALLAGNRLVGNRVGVYLDDSPRETTSVVVVEENLLAANDVGLSLLPNVERGRFAGNSFVENGQQVEIAGGGALPSNVWQGNYWSDYTGYDAAGDGTGDLPYRSDKLFEDLADRHPELRLFLASPLTRALDLASQAFPLVRPRPRLADQAPRMRPRSPAGCPPLAAGDGRPFLALGGGLALAALLIVALPGLLRRSGRGWGGTATWDGALLAPGVAARAAEGEGPLVRVEGLGKSFAVHRALDGVSFTLAPGEAVAVWGPNGAGKTTALRALLGVIPAEGRLEVAGFDPWRQGKEARRRIGFVPQEVSLQSDLGVVETLELFARLRRVPVERIWAALAAVGLEGEAGKRVGELSGGLRQRLALAVALLADPPLLILDEPTANLDARARADFLALLRGLHRQGKTLVFSSHRPEEVRSLADRVLVLEAGRLVADVPVGEALLNGREAQLWLRLATTDLERAAAALSALGLHPRRLGAHLVLEVPAQRKALPFAALAAAGIAVEDFELEVGEVRRGPGGPDGAA